MDAGPADAAGRVAWKQGVAAEVGAPREMIQATAIEQATQSRSAGGVLVRVISGLVAGPCLVFVAWQGGWLYAAVVTAATAIAALEVRGMLRSGGYRPLSWLLVGLAAAIPLNAFVSSAAGQGSGLDALLQARLPAAGAPTTGAVDSTSVLLVLAVLLSLASLLCRAWSESALVDWALSLALALYLGGLMQFFAPLRNRDDGAYWAIAMLLVSWTCDTAAFFVGRTFGKRRLAPRISPKKSVEGAVAGLVGAGAMAVLIGALAALPPFSDGSHSLLVMLGFGIAVGLATEIGDLVESLVKRQTGVKDSGVLIPGHGGIMDRMDSLLYCAPVAALYLLLVAA